MHGVAARVGSRFRIARRAIQIFLSKLHSGFRLLGRTMSRRSALVACGVVVLVICSVTLISYFSALGSLQTSQELVTLSVARRCAQFLEHGLSGAPSKDELDIQLKLISELNPTIDLYLLDRHGIVIAHSAGQEHLELPFVDLRPIRRALAVDTRTNDAGADGDDPRAMTSIRPFSVAPVRYGESNGYLYLLLRRETSDLLRGALTRRMLYLDVPLIVLMTLLGAGVLGGLVLFVTGSRTVGIETLVSQVSHDLRSPLAALQASLENLVRSEQISKTAESAKLLRSVAASSRSLVEMLAGLSNVTQLDGKNFTLRLEPIDPVDLLSDLASKYRPLSAGRSIHLALVVPDKLPMIQGDIALLDRAISNVIENALKFSSSGGTVTVSAEVEKKKLVIEVIDTGVGIPTEEISFVFERFYRAENSKDRAGTGLGLGIARQIAELHRGTVTLSSVQGGGTTVRIALPTA